MPSLSAIAGNSRMLYVADAGNHRVLGWSGLPGGDADLVLGQTSFSTAIEWPYTAQGPSAQRFPYGLALEGVRLAVADTANNRVLFWPDLPSIGAGLAASAVTGQLDFEGNGEKRWKAVLPDSLCWPYRIAMHGELLAVADSGNNRVMLINMEEDRELISASQPTATYAIGDY